VTGCVNSIRTIDAIYLNFCRILHLVTNLVNLHCRNKSIVLPGDDPLRVETCLSYIKC